MAEQLKGHPRAPTVKAPLALALTNSNSMFFFQLRMHAPSPTRQLMKPETPFSLPPSYTVKYETCHFFSVERGVTVPSGQAWLDLRTLHRQPDQEGPLGVLALVDGGAQSGQTPVCMTSDPHLHTLNDRRRAPGEMFL